MERHSFYYKDSLDLKVLYPRAYSFSLLYPDDNIVIDNGVMYLSRPDSFNPLRISNIVRVYIHKYDYFKIEINIKCWRDDGPRLKEVTPYKFLALSSFFSNIRRLKRKLGLWPHRLLLQTCEGVSYYYNKGRLERKRNDGIELLGKMPPLQSPIYNEFIVVGDEAFLRTGHYIYRSVSNMRYWEKIYEGKRAIKDSMIWIKEDNSLLFLEYTPGLKQSRHHVYKYFLETGETKTVLTFYTPDEYVTAGFEPYCRHIHVVSKDPFTNYIYLGVGDSDDESAIYISKDNGNNFLLLGKGSQAWRTLAFFFTKENVYWNTDSPDPQYISGIKKSQTNNIPLSRRDLLQFPLFNGACWNTFYDYGTNTYMMSSSCEGQLYDNRSRILSVAFEKGTPIVYNMFTDRAINNHPGRKFQQLFVIGKDIEGYYWFYDLCRYCYRIFIVE